MVYLDNAATTKPLDFVNTEWGNPNSSHGFGVAVYNEMRKARDRIKAAIGAKSGRVVFGYNATHLMEQICKHSVSYIHCSPYEHSSVTNSMKGIPTLRNFEDINTYQNIWNEDCFEWMMVNNLSGTIYDVERIGAVVKAPSSGLFLRFQVFLVASAPCGAGTRKKIGTKGKTTK